MSRAEQKEKTRQAIIQAALTLSEGKNFASLSLREVTREVGIAPAGFYRHFSDMDALALTLVDEVGTTLRQLMRQARQRLKVESSVVNVSIDTFMEFLAEQPQLFRILSAERAGGPIAVRQALRREREHFVQDLIHDLSADSKRQKTPLQHIPEASDLMVNQVFNGGLDALDMSEKERKALAKKLKLQLRITLAGCRAMAIKN